MIPGLEERRETFQVDNMRKGILDREKHELCSCLGVGVKVAGNGIRKSTWAYYKGLCKLPT